MKSEDNHGFFMARQPIFDRQNCVVAYELLYRKSQTAPSVVVSGSDDLQALMNVLVDVGLDMLVENSIAFVNVSPQMLESDALRLLPPKRVVLEVLEGVEYSPAVHCALESLRESGYRLALDDYVFEERHLNLLSLVDLIKVDVMALEPEELAAKIPALRAAGRTLLAEKVESRDMHVFCLELGFDLFQGYFFAKPDTLRGSGVPESYQSLISLLAKLQDPSVSIDDLDGLVSSNISLCHKLLRLVNCAAYGLNRKLDSVKQAILFLGISKVRTLTEMAIVSSMPGKPPQLYELAIVRARFCERLAEISGLESPELHFTTGLLSVLDALTNTPIDEVVAGLPLNQEIAQALLQLESRGDCSRSLASIKAVESGRWSDMNQLAPQIPPGLYEDSLSWARDQTRLLAA